MAQDIVLGITLKADGSGLKGAIAGVSQEIRQQEPLWKSMAAGMGLVNAATIVLEAGMAKVRQALGFVSDSVKDAARYQTLGVAMEQVGRNAGYNAEQMAGFETELRKSGIAMIESRQTLTQMASAQVDLAKSGQLARIAQDAAVIGNINSSEAFARMIHGIQSGQVEILRTIGITVNFEAAYQKLAQQLGINAALLTENEKSQARANAVMEFGPRIAGAYEAAMGTAGKQMSSLKRYLDDLSVKMGTGFLEAFTAQVFGQADSLKALGSEMDKLLASGDVERWGHSLAEGLNTAGSAAKSAATTLWDHRTALEMLGGAYLTFKVASSLGPWIAERATAAAAAAQYYGALASGNAVMVGGATAARQKAIAEEQATAAELLHAEAAHAATLAFREQQIAVLAAANAQYQAATSVGAYSASLAASEAAGAARIQAMRQLADLSRQAASAESTLATATAAHAAAQANLSRVTEATALRARAASAAQGALAASTAALGGPIGVIIAALGVGASLWVAFGDQGKSALDELDERSKSLAGRLDRVNKELKYGSGDKGAAAEDIDQARAGMAAMRATFQASEEFLAKNNEYYRQLKKQEEDAMALIAKSDEIDAKRRSGAGKSGKASGRFQELATQFATKPKMEETLGILEREKAEELKIAGDDASKKADIERMYQQTRKSIIEQMGADAHRAQMEVFDREETAQKASLQSRLLSIETANRMGALNVREYEDAKLAIEADYFEQSGAILARKFAAARDASEREKILNEQAQLNQARLQQEEQARAAKVIALNQELRGMANWAAQQREANELIRFETELLGKDALAVEQARAAKDADLALRAQIMEAYIDENGQLQDREKKLLPEVIARYKELAEAEKEARAKAIADQDEKARDWLTGQQAALNDYIRNTSDAAAQANRLWTDAFRGMEDALVDFAKTGKLDFKSLADSIIGDLIRIQVQNSITKPLAQMMGGAGGAGGFGGLLGSLFGGGGSGFEKVFDGVIDEGGAASWASALLSAKGNVFSSPDLSAHSNTILTEPTLFRYAKGAAFGVGGEAGFEAVMPLTRGGDGVLGVRAQVGGAGPGVGEIRVQIQNNGTPQKVVSAAPTFDARGMVLTIVTEDIAQNGPVSRRLQSTYGLNRAAGAY